MLAWLSDRYGRRGTWLLMFGGLWIFFGIGQLLEPTPARSWVLNEYAPAWLNAAGWAITGSIAVWQGLRGKGRDDSRGHVALYVMPAVRLVSFTFAWLLWAIASLLIGHSATLGWPQGWYAALVWLLVILPLRFVADWPNPQPFPAPPNGASGRL